VNQHNPPLRYRISAWEQLNDCVSNLSRDLSIRVSKFVNNDILEGTRIAVLHTTYGVLFACMVNSSGSLIQPASNGQPHEFTPSDILSELYKYGFDVEYRPAKGLPGAQIAYLMTLKGLGYDKIRIISVWSYSSTGAREYKEELVAFLNTAHGDWLNSGYSPSKTEFIDALNSGTAINLTAISGTKSFNWSWLYNWVANIDDILRECAEVES
jgi:hypothetical protein